MPAPYTLAVPLVPLNSVFHVAGGQRHETADRKRLRCPEPRLPVWTSFKPTDSQYSFVLLADRRSLSPQASVRHGKTGDTGDYAAGDVEATAFRVACAAIKSSRD